MPKQLLNIDQVVELTGLSVQTIYRRTRLKTFPPPVDSMYVPEKLKNKKHWAKTEVTKWVKANVKPDNAKANKKMPVARDRIRTIEEPKVDPFVEAVERSVQGQLVAETESQKRKRMVIWALLIAVIIVAVVIAI
jgi:predicted DNA-binding transcriptional regulator AlpA